MTSWNPFCVGNAIELTSLKLFFFLSFRATELKKKQIICVFYTYMPIIIIFLMLKVNDDVLN